MGAERLPNSLKAAGNGGAQRFAEEWNKIPREFHRLAVDHLQAIPPLMMNAYPDRLVLYLSEHEIRRFARLRSPTWAGGAAVDADLLEYDGTAWNLSADPNLDPETAKLQVDLTFAPSGYYFADHDVEIAWREHAERWYVVGGRAAHYVAGELLDDLAGSTARLIVAQNQQEITVYDVWGPADEGDTIGCLWNDDELRWEGALQRC